MIIEEFNDYLSIPFMTKSRDYRKNTRTENIDTLFHYHKEMELLAVLEGSARLFVNEEVYEIEKGDLVVIAPYTPHRYTIFADRDFKHYCMCFDLDILYDKELNRDFMAGNASVENVIRKDPSCLERAKAAYLARQEKNPGWEYEVIGNLSLLFGLFERNRIIRNLQKNQKSSFVESAVKYIAMHYNEPVTSSDISAYLHFNNSYFCRLFRKNFGYNFQTYLIRYRIERAKILLRNTNMPVSQIASSVGFNSFSYFGKLFRQFTGVSPKEYRSIKRGKTPLEEGQQ